MFHVPLSVAPTTLSFETVTRGIPEPLAPAPVTTFVPPNCVTLLVQGPPVCDTAPLIGCVACQKVPLTGCVTAEPSTLTAVAFAAVLARLTWSGVEEVPTSVPDALRRLENS